jgi:hypothetical protein
MTWVEFQDLTLPQLEALEERRNVSIRHARFNAGLVASMLFNAHRDKDAEPLEVWDFISGYERDAEEVEREKLRRSIKSGVVVAFTRMKGKNVEQVRAQAAAMIQSMTAAGTEGADGIVREAFEEVVRVPYAESANG